MSSREAMQGGRASNFIKDLGCNQAHEVHRHASSRRSHQSLGRQIRIGKPENQVFVGGT